MQRSILLLLALLALSLPAHARPGIEAVLVSKLQALQPLPRPAFLADEPKSFLFGRDKAQPLPPLREDASPRERATADSRLKSLAPLFTWPAPPVPQALHATPDDECAFELGSVALQYRADPDGHRDRFFALLAIDDYATRAAMKMRLLGREDLGRAVEAVFTSRPGLDVEVLQELAAFCAFRENDPWFVHTDEGYKSFARAVRVKMVQHLLAGTDEVEDVPEMVRLIDGHTDLQHAPPRADAPAPLTPMQESDLAARLEALSAWFAMPQKKLPEQLQPAPDDDCAATLVATALQYRADPDTHRARLHELLKIDDYADRAAGKQEPVWAEDVESVIKAAYSSIPSLRDERLRSAVAFCELERSRLWVITPKLERISLARVVRSATLELLLDGTDEDVSTIVNGIDERAEKAYLERRRKVPSGQ